MDKVLTSTYTTNSIKITLVNKNNGMFGSLNDEPMRQIKNITEFIRENKLIIGEEELNFIIGFTFMVEKQKNIEEETNDNLNNLLSSI